MSEFSPFRKEHTVKVLSNTLTFAQEVPIVWNSTQSHICLQHLVISVSESFPFTILFTLSQAERLYKYLACQSVMQSTIIHDDIIYYPRCSTSTYNKNYIPTSCSPTIPEVVQ